MRQHPHTGPVESPVLGDGYAGFGRRSGETGWSKGQHRAPGRPYQHVPVARTAELIGDLTGARVSAGWVGAQVAKAAGIVAGSLRLIRALLTLSHVVHADETTTNIAGKRRYLHVACTPGLTHLALGPRSRAAVNAVKILPGVRGTLVHDAYFQLYDGYPDARHQLCVAHYAEFRVMRSSWFVCRSTVVGGLGVAA